MKVGQAAVQVLRGLPRRQLALRHHGVRAERRPRSLHPQGQGPQRQLP